MNANQIAEPLKNVNEMRQFTIDTFWWMVLKNKLLGFNLENASTPNYIYYITVPSRSANSIAQILRNRSFHVKSIERSGKNDYYTRFMINMNNVLKDTINQLISTQKESVTPMEAAKKSISETRQRIKLYNCNLWSYISKQIEENRQVLIYKLNKTIFLQISFGYFPDDTSAYYSALIECLNEYDALRALRRFAKNDGFSSIKYNKKTGILELRIVAC